jgi:1-aminocyclopropane-1-carboxylate deaminase/D-cysteine desulfhydrase-like pyridoxal-dependent ACC family enzyme
MISLFEANPMLIDRLPHWQVCSLPTPVEKLAGFGERAGVPDLFVKRDDLSGDLFGGNKVRTLEFLLPAAHRDGGNLVVGLAGTSMALAANVYARHYGLPLKTYLVRQKPSRESRANLGYLGLLDADLEQIESQASIESAVRRFNAESLTWYGHPAHRLDANSPLGMCGYANAGFELAAQVRAGEIPAPDLVFLAAGLLGTTAGLLVGLRSAGLRAKIVAVNHDWMDAAAAAAGAARIAGLVAALCDYLRVFSPDFPELEIEPGDLELAGPAPGAPDGLIETGLGEKARLEKEGRFSIEPTWTAQVIGEIKRQASAGGLAGQTVLYWHTINSRPYPEELESVDYHVLPEDFWPHFEADELTRINKPAAK